MCLNPRAVGKNPNRNIHGFGVLLLSALLVTGPSHSICCADLSRAAHTGEVSYEGSGPASVRM